MKIKDWLANRRKKREESERKAEEERYQTNCVKCRVRFDAMKQSGLCPHIPVKEFIFDYKKRRKTE